MHTTISRLLIALAATAPAWGSTDTLYKASQGPHAIRVVAVIELAVPERDRIVPVRLSYPKGNGPFPLVVFSHGALCTGDGYVRLADHWASHGYVVLLPTHLGSDGAGRPDADEASLVFQSQIADMSSLLDNLPVIESKFEELHGAIDPTRIAAAGHSMGALVAIVVSGLPVLEPGGRQASYADERFDVAILLSGPGPLPNIPHNAWKDVQLPTFVSTGTRDHANRGGPGATWKWRLGAYERTPGGNKHALIIDKADHFIGGLICDERGEGPPDHEALMIVQSASTAFLDAYLKKDSAAMAYLNSAAVVELTNGRAKMLAR